jgi:hypothetical protein
MPIELHVDPAGPLDDRVGALTPEGRKKACDESINVLWRHLDVSGVVLRADADLRNGRRHDIPRDGVRARADLYQGVRLLKPGGEHAAGAVDITILCHLQ